MNAGIDGFSRIFLDIKKKFIVIVQLFIVFIVIVQLSHKNVKMFLTNSFYCTFVDTLMRQCLK